MFIEYSQAMIMGGTWTIMLAYLIWIYEDGKRHNKGSWPWILGFLAIQVPGMIISNYYWMMILPSRGIEAGPFFTFDTSQFVEPLWALDALFVWNTVATSIINSTISVSIVLWIYRDCQKTGIRATPWIFGLLFVQYMPFPISLVLGVISGWRGQVFVLVGYILHKLGYI